MKMRNNIIDLWKSIDRGRFKMLVFLNCVLVVFLVWLVVDLGSSFRDDFVY